MADLSLTTDLDRACLAFEVADEKFIRTARQDRAYDRLSLARDVAHDRLVYLLGLRREVHHCRGKAFWVDRGELHRSRLKLSSARMDNQILRERRSP